MEVCGSATHHVVGGRSVSVSLRRFVRGGAGSLRQRNAPKPKPSEVRACVTGPGSRGRVRYITQNNAARNRWHLLSTSVTHRGFVDQGTALRRTVDKNYE